MSGNIIPAVIEGEQVLHEAYDLFCANQKAKRVEFSVPVYEIIADKDGAFVYREARTFNIGNRSYVAVCGENYLHRLGYRWVLGTSVFPIEDSEDPRSVREQLGLAVRHNNSFPFFLKDSLLAVSNRGEIGVIPSSRFARRLDGLIAEPISNLCVSGSVLDHTSESAKVVKMATYHETLRVPLAHAIERVLINEE